LSATTRKPGLLDRIELLIQLGIVPPAWHRIELLHENVMNAGGVHEIGMTPVGERHILFLTAVLNVP
jgi:hypothetical protein